MNAERDHPNHDIEVRDRDFANLEPNELWERYGLLLAGHQVGAQIEPTVTLSANLRFIEERNYDAVNVENLSRNEARELDQHVTSLLVGPDLGHDLGRLSEIQLKSFLKGL